MNSPYSAEAMRAEFKRLTAEREQILAQSAPLRAERNQVLAEAEAKASDLARRVREIEKGLFEIDVQRGMLARALAGRGGRIARTG